MNRLGRQWARFGRFNLIGLLGGVLQLLLLQLWVKYFHLPGTASAVIAVEIVVLHNFFWHERFTWRDRNPAGMRQMAARLWRFHVSNGLISIAGNGAFIFLLVEHFKAPVLPSSLAAIASCAPINFLISDRWVYRELTQAPSAAAMASGTLARRM